MCLGPPGPNREGQAAAGRAWLATGAENSCSGNGGCGCLDGAAMPGPAVASGHRSSPKARAKHQAGTSAARALSSLFFRHGEAVCSSRHDRPLGLITGCQACPGSGGLAGAPEKDETGRPKTWVTFRTGHMGYTFRFFASGRCGCRGKRVRGDVPETWVTTSCRAHGAHH